jgi:hypothetical protein
MSILTSDTYRFVIEFQKSGFAIGQAKGINSVFNLAIQTGEVETKHDIKEAVSEIKADAAEQRTSKN